MRKNTTEFIIIVMLWVSVLTSSIFNRNFSLSFIFGMVALVVVTLTFKKYKDASLGLLFFFLFLSVFYIINFSTVFGVSVGFLGISINVPSLALFLILSFRRVEDFFRLKKDWLGQDDSEIADSKSNRIKMFKTEFKNLSNEELLKKLDNPSMVEDAKTATVEILKEREN